MIRIEVKSAAVNVKSGTARNSGKPYEIRTQEGYAHTVDGEGKPRPYPQRCEIPLQKGQEPYAPGNYTVSAASFYVGDYDRLMISLRLQPVAAVKAA